MFTSSDRDGARELVLEMSTRDPRIVGCAEIGGLVEGGDRWSDLDLTFAVGGTAEVADVLEDWTSELVSTLKAARLFDLPSGSTIYRVFLLPNCLQIDLSFTPECDFGARGPKFRLLFGRANEIPHASHLRLGSSSASASIMQSELESASSVGASGRPNTGSVQLGIARSRWPVGAAALTSPTVGVSTTCPQRCLPT